MLVSSVGLLRMTGTPGNIAKSNENLKRISFGLLGVYSLITLLYTFNRDLVNGDIGLDAGYWGLYGMPLAEIEKKKNLKKGELLDKVGGKIRQTIKDIQGKHYQKI
jgi:hypothetical protein